MDPIESRSQPIAASGDVALTGDAESGTPSRGEAPAKHAASSVVSPATLAAIVVGMIVGAVYRQGAFYPSDAFGLAVLSGAVVAFTILRNRERAGAAVSVTVGGLAVWWLVRAIVERSPDAFFPLGASLLGFLAAYLVIRSLELRDRFRVTMAIVAIGSLSASAGVVGVLWRWHPLAQQVNGIWQVSTTLTYPAAAAVLFIIALLMAMALDLHSPLTRAALCLCLAGLVGTQSHWDLLALALGALAVPRRRWPEALWPLAMGLLAGLVVVASAAGSRPGWPSSAAVVVAVAASTLTGRRTRSGAWRRQTVLGAILLAGCATVLMVYPPVEHIQGQPANQSQTLAWSASVEAWRSSVLTGVGPPPVYNSHESVATYPGLAPDGYLTVIAEGGLLGALLLLGAGVAVAATFRGRSLVSSCALAGAVAFVVAGNVDFDWQLPALGLFGGCIAGLATGQPGRREGPPDTVPARRARRLPGRAAVAWTLVVSLVVTAQLLVGVTQEASGVPAVQGAPPAPSATPEQPARFILTGPDSADPFMLEDRGRYYLYTGNGVSMNVPVWIGSKPGHWGNPIDVMPQLPGWAQDGLTWAPDVQRVAGGWALYFTALAKGLNPGVHCIGSAFASSPAGPFVPGKYPFICQLNHRGSIDARVFVDAGNHLVMLWKSDDNADPSNPGVDQNGRTGFYAQDLSANGRVLLGQPVRIFAPSQAWEGTIVEAPDMVEAWGTYWLIFSGNWFDSASYGIGVAACQSPFGPCSDPDPHPFLGSNEQGAGPGEASIFRNGVLIYLLYNPFHATDSFSVVPRPVALTRLGFTPQGPYLAAG